MPRIALSRSAVAKLLADPMLRRWRAGEFGCKRPVLWYFQRAYTTKGDGTIIEHGDGFSLTFAEPKDLDQPKLDFTTVAVATGLDILVATSPERLFGDLLIGWRMWKYTCEPLGE